MKVEARTKIEFPEDLADLRQQLAEVKKLPVDIEKVLYDLQTSETRYRRLFETAKDGILILDATTGQIDDVNPYLIDMLHYTKEEFLGKKLWEVSAFKNTTLNQSYFKELQDKRYIRYKDMPLETKEGKSISVEFISNIYAVNGNKVIQCNIRNITEYKREGEELRKSKMLLESVFNSTQDLVLVVDRDLRILMSNWKSPACADHTEFSIKSHCYEVFVHRDTPCEPCHVLGVFDTGKPILTEYYNPYTKQFKDVNAYPIFDDNNHVIMVAEHVRDITERKQGEEDIKESEEKYRLSFENASDVIYSIDTNFQVTSISPIVKRLLGYKPEELIGRSVSSLSDILTPESLEKALHDIKRVFSGETISSTIYEYITRDGSRKYGDASVSPIMKDGKIIGLISVARDVTNRVHAEAALKQSEERFQSLFDNSIECVYVLDLEGKFIDANQATLNLLGFNREDIPNINFWMLMDADQLPKAVQAISEVLETGYGRKTYECRVKGKDGRYVDVETSETVVYHEGKPHSILGVARDITERKLNFDRLRKAMMATVQAMATVVETRDPYTAGHQRRVADLARSIATEMGLSKNQIEGIRTAATIHDIGKISIPAEILSKPSKLTDLEYNLIKVHAQSGYDILKDIEFPWPVARMVLEHHERIDGSGYPNGLKGEDILLESRILALADVVEAMASHRPYRPALGIDAAMEEIAKNKGTLFDPEAVDACLRLFNQKNYKIVDR